MNNPLNGIPLSNNTPYAVAMDLSKSDNIG